MHAYRVLSVLAAVVLCHSVVGTMYYLIYAHCCLQHPLIHNQVRYCFLPPRQALSSPPHYLRELKIFFNSFQHFSPGFHVMVGVEAGVCQCINYSAQCSFILRVILQQLKSTTMPSKPSPVLRESVVFTWREVLKIAGTRG